MLSKVAERIYWVARYLERVESTARLVSIYDKLLFDLPHPLNLSWYNLVVINGIEKDYEARYTLKDERHVVKFLLGDKDNPSSMVVSLAAMRENVRTTRDVIPEEVWELANELNLYVEAHLQQGIQRGKRHQFLEDVIKGCQQILGVIYTNMPHDDAWHFMRMGSSLERADMTTRNLDAGMAAILQMDDDENTVNSQQIIWGNVLRSLNAMQSYRRSLRNSVKGTAVLEYLIADVTFPRAIIHCLQALISACHHLPNALDLADRMLGVQQFTINEFHQYEFGEPLRDFLNRLQIHLGEVHNTIAASWFLETDNEH